jgi:hypothetical protein
LPHGLPAHLGVGLAAPPSPDGLDGWLPDSGIPFDYAYQYLAGGVNTGNGWQTWQPAAAFPLSYATSASAHHVIPVLDYYMLLQSNGPCAQCGEGEKDLAHLNDPSTMTAYFLDFSQLMKRLGPGTWDGVKGYGGTAIVHVEPDLSGFAEQAVLGRSSCHGHCLGKGNGPSLLRTAVASTGVADVVGFQNNYRDFNQALIHLRDLYAPNVLLGFHVSAWATGVDIGSSDGSVDAEAEGLKAARFAAASGATAAVPGASSYDLIFTDVADRDAGISHVWWDPSNRSVPNFLRWEMFVRTVSQTTGHWMMVWQVPLGNQWFRTENGSDGHTQDNRVQYFFDHPNELVGAGVAGILFGRGNGRSTTNTDADHDGVTNPPAICTSAGSLQPVCNNHVSTSPDDDGGYLRLRATEYYLHPASLVAGGSP